MRKDDKELKDKLLQIRLSKLEKQMLMKVSFEKDMSISEFVRFCVDLYLKETK